MRKSISLIILLIILSILFLIPVQAATPTTVTLLNPPPSGVLELAVGETYVFDILVTSDEAFTIATALPDQYYPGRGVFFNGSDNATNATSATLHLKMTGKASTANLPDGVAPASVMVGVRYAGGVLVVEQFDFVVRVS